MESKEDKFEWHGIKMEDLRQIMDKPADDSVQSIFEKENVKKANFKRSISLFYLF